MVVWICLDGYLFSLSSIVLSLWPCVWDLFVFSTHMTMISYLHECPGLVHFIYIDRSSNEVIAPNFCPLHGKESIQTPENALASEDFVRNEVSIWFHLFCQKKKNHFSPISSCCLSAMLFSLPICKPLVFMFEMCWLLLSKSTDSRLKMICIVWFSAQEFWKFIFLSYRCEPIGLDDVLLTTTYYFTRMYRGNFEAERISILVSTMVWRARWFVIGFCFVLSFFFLLFLSLSPQKRIDCILRYICFYFRYIDLLFYMVGRFSSVRTKAKSLTRLKRSILLSCFSAADTTSSLVRCLEIDVLHAMSYMLCILVLFQMNIFCNRIGNSSQSFDLRSYV